MPKNSLILFNQDLKLLTTLPYLKKKSLQKYFADFYLDEVTANKNWRASKWFLTYAA